VSHWFIVHQGLTEAARVPSLARSRERISAVEVLLLLMSGAAAAAAVGMAKLGLGIPGHAIVLAALPLAFGMSVAPRRLAGSLMSAAALGTAWVLRAAGAADYGSGSMVSLCLLGPMMDVALRRVGAGWRLYAALVAAGVATNVLALGSRAATKIIGLDLGGRPFDSWWLLAVVTYTLSGVVAGLLGAFCWFHVNERSEPRRQA
jgi:hypothetical protein